MPNKPPPAVRNDDPRVQRSTHALGVALVELMREHEFHEITVQQILDRAGVGRATFYAHFRNKRDVLHSGFERLFRAMDAVLDGPAARGRVFPVEEFLDHVRASTDVVRALSRPEMDELWTQAVAYVGRIIEARIEPVRGQPPAVPAHLVGRMLGGALVEMTKWAEDRPASNRVLDTAFHALAVPALARARYTVRARAVRQA